MNAKRFFAVTTLALVIPTMALARPGDNGRRQGPPPQQGPDITQIAQHLTRQLDLTADQQEQLDQIVKDHEEEFAANSDTRKQMRELRQQLREARRAGDEEAVSDLEAQMDTLREQRRAVMDAFVADVEAILTDAQKEKYAEMRERMQQRGEQRGPDGNRERGRRGSDGDRGERGQKGQRGKMECQWEERGMGQGQQGREGRRGPQGGPGERPNIQQLLKELPEKLDLTDEQKVKYDALVADLKAKMKEHREAMAELKPLIEEMQEARRAGDKERAEELKKEIDSKRPERGELMKEFKDGLDKILTDTQKQKLESLMPMRGPGGPGDGLMRGLQQVDLTEEQKAEIKKIMDKAHEDILALLTDEQKEKLEQLKQQRPRDGRGQKEKAGKGKQRGERDGQRSRRGGRGGYGDQGQRGGYED